MQSLSAQVLLSLTVVADVVLLLQDSVSHWITTPVADPVAPFDSVVCTQD